MTGQPIMFDFDHPSRFLPFADPAHAPDWLSRTDPQRPRWLTTDEEALAQYCLDQLDELDRRAMALSAEASEAINLLWRNRDKSLEGSLGIFLDNIGWTREQYETAKRRKSEERDTEQMRSGPTRADPRRRNELPSALAAQDIAKLRFVIFPRFWDRKNRKRPSAEQIAARRQGLTDKQEPRCTPSEAESWYENNNVAAFWNRCQA